MGNITCYQRSLLSSFMSEFLKLEESDGIVTPKGIWGSLGKDENGTETQMFVSTVLGEFEKGEVTVKLNGSTDEGETRSFYKGVSWEFDHVPFDKWENIEKMINKCHERWFIKMADIIIRNILDSSVTQVGIVGMDLSPDNNTSMKIKFNDRVANVASLDLFLNSEDKIEARFNLFNGNEVQNVIGAITNSDIIYEFVDTVSYVVL